jgi:predicted LPLAT superfamily acyltransferase
MASFPQGPYIIGALMQCPVYALFCQRDGKRYRLHAAKIADRIDLPRAGRDAVLARHAETFAGLLQQHALADPLQWYNFFDFWAERPA